MEQQTVVNIASSRTERATMKVNYLDLPNQVWETATNSCVNSFVRASSKSHSIARPVNQTEQIKDEISVRISLKIDSARKGLRL